MTKQEQLKDICHCLFGEYPDFMLKEDDSVYLVTCSDFGTYKTLVSLPYEKSLDLGLSHCRFIGNDEEEAARKAIAHIQNAIGAEKVDTLLREMRQLRSKLK